MPILGILASSTPAAAGDFESIATVTVGAGGSSSVTFSSIPSTYTHLQLRFIARQTSASGTQAYYLEVNGDTGNSYTNHFLYGNGSTVTAEGYATGNFNGFGPMYITGTADSNIYSVGIIDILDYANTNKNKTIRGLHGHDANGSGNIYLTSTGWLSTSAISSLKFFRTSSTIAQYSQIALYGIKSA
jgi:hypothetical protein